MKKDFIANLSSTEADIRKLNVKKISLNGQDISELISSSGGSVAVKYTKDTRETFTDNDLWGQWIETLDDGTVIIHDDEVTNPDGTFYSPWFESVNESITKLENNKLYIGDELYANVQTEKIKDASYMFYYSTLESFDSDLSSLEKGYGMFWYVTSLESFNSNLSSLTNGSTMFARTSISTFNSDLSSLTNGYYMFLGCENLTTFTTDLSSLIDGESMFSASNLTTFTSDLSSLTNGRYMFSGCLNLDSFDSDLSSLRKGEDMFSNCSKLTSFTSNLSSLTNGNSMFYNCILDTESLIYIADTIKDVRDLTNSGGPSPEIYKKIHIGLGHTPTEEDTELLTEIYNKGWQVYVGVNHGSSSEFNPTALIDDEEITIPTPYWAKPQETDAEHAKYEGADGKYYIILGGNYIFVDDKETYGLFTCLEEAEQAMGLTKVVKEIPSRPNRKQK